MSRQDEPEAGARAPDFTLKDGEGRDWRLADQRGRVGISKDSPESHRAFAEHHSLPLRLLSDPEGRAAALYGAKSWLPGRTARAVVVIDAEGVVRHNKAQPLSLFRPKDDEVLAAIRAAQGAQ